MSTAPQEAHASRQQVVRDHLVTVTTPYAELRQTGRPRPQAVHIDLTRLSFMAGKSDPVTGVPPPSGSARWAPGPGITGRDPARAEAALPPGRILRACRRRHESAVPAVFLLRGCKMRMASDV